MMQVHIIFIVILSIMAVAISTPIHHIPCHAPRQPPLPPIPLPPAPPIATLLALNSTNNTTLPPLPPVPPPPPPPPNLEPIIMELAASEVVELNNTHNSDIGEIDVYEKLRHDTYLFYRATHLHVDEFEQLHNQLRNLITWPRNSQPASHAHQCNLSTKNRLLMTLMWLAGYQVYQDMRLAFQISQSTFVCEIQHVVRTIILSLHNEIQWPTPGEQQEMHMRFGTLFRYVVGAIDCFHVPINRPGYNAPSFYRGDKHIHSVITQLVVNAMGSIIHIETGYPGRNNDCGMQRKEKKKNKTNQSRHRYLQSELDSTYQCSWLNQSASC